MKASAAERAVAIVGVGAILPDAPNAPKFWQNIREGVYSIKEVPRDRWNPDLYYDANPKSPDKTYCKIGGWVCDWEWDPLKWKLPIPPRVSQLMDLTQKWGIATAREALADYGWPDRPLNQERTAVIYGNAMGGDMHLYSAARIFFPEFTEELKKASGFASLPPNVRKSIIEQMYEGIDGKMPSITEDTMPGELSNILAGRIAALYNFNGPNYVTDAACASAIAGITAAVGGLVDGDYDAVVTGGIDANMSPSTFVKFCKIGALSPTGSRPYAAGSDGFIMGEGGATFILKRLADAERDGDKIYAVIRGIGGSSDGKGKGITAPNPAGQKYCIRRAWEKAGVRPTPGILIEGHGTSTPVGDAAELQALSESFQEFGLPTASIALGSVKSNIGHLKGGAGAAGILKATLALHEKLLPPSLNFDMPNPNVDFANIPFYVNTELLPWEIAPGEARRAAVSAFGFGGTNFHIVLEEYIPGRIASELRSSITVPEMKEIIAPAANLKAPLRGALVVGASSEAELKVKLEAARKDAEAGIAPAPSAPAESDLRADMRVAIDYGDAAELADKIVRAIKALEENQVARWKALRPKGIFFGKGPAPKVAFLFTGQGSQYVNMVHELRRTEPTVANVFDEADRVMEPLIEKPLTECIYLDKSDEAALAEAEDGLKQTAITQPAVLATETALARLIGAYGIVPDMVMGHSLGEYGALVAAGAITFENALKAVSARGQEMTKCAMDDNGLMAAAFGPIDEIQKVLDGVSDYVVIANINSSKEAVIGGSTAGVEKAVADLQAAGFRAQVLQVSHAFHTSIVAPAGEALTEVLKKMNIQPAAIPIITNVTGEFYPMGPGVVPEMISLLGRQVSSPVQFIKGLNTLYDAGARVFVEMGPKRILYGFVEDVLGSRDGVTALFTNHPRIGEAASVNLALCGLYAAGLGCGTPEKPVVNDQWAAISGQGAGAHPAFINKRQAESLLPITNATRHSPLATSNEVKSDRYAELGKLFTEFMDRSFQVYSRGYDDAAAPADICVTGASLGLPGVDGVFQDSNVERLLRGDSFINPVPLNLREEMVDKNIVRLVKSESGEGRFETIENIADVIKLAARAKGFDIERDFGFPKERLAALDRVTRLAIGAGIDAMRDAGIPLVMSYKTTTRGTLLPDRWQLPEEMRDDTGILFTSAFPGYDYYAQFMTDFHNDKARREKLKEFESLRVLASGAAADELDRRIAALKKEIEEKAYQFDRRFLFQVLSMGHSQFAEYIGARGPNTATNAACSSGTQAVALAGDWIRTGRCRRVIVISADDITSDNLFGWFGSGFLASGSAATGEIVEEEATPFDRRRHGLIIGMGASSVIVESAEAARERGIRPICRLLGSVVANSAFHGTRLDVAHICDVMEKLISSAEKDWGINRYEIAPATVFVSHETYTPARGGSASAEVFALRHVFGDATDKIVIANTKGATGHPMAVGIEDVASIKILETGIVPPVPNFREVDPELGNLNLSKGGSYPVRYALRLGAGFGSQISMTLFEWTPGTDGRRPAPSSLGYGYRVEDQGAWNTWLQRATGYATPEIEIERRTLRVKDQGPTASIVVTTGAAVAPVMTPTAAVAPVMTPTAAIAPVVTPTAAIAPSGVSTSAASIVSSTNEVQAKVMQIIAEKTGYPTDMLDTELDLEADLGIDTVKQAEMFAAIREAYDIPREDNLKMRDFPTLGHVIQFVFDRRPDLVAVTMSAAVQSMKSYTQTASATDHVKEKVMQIIAEKTGYPTDMLDPELDLEADLGIDTVKQAEMFAAIRESYDIPREDNLKMRDFPTLGHVIQFVFDRRPDLVAVTISGAVHSMESSTQAASAPDHVKEKVMQIIAEKTGYPTDMLDPELDLEADLGIDTVKQAEMFAAIRESYDIPRDENLKMRDFPTLGHVIQFVYDHRPDLLSAVTTTATPAAAIAPSGVSISAADVAPAISSTNEVQAKVIQIIAEKTGYPADMLDLDLDLEADLGVDTVKQAEMFAAIREEYNIPRDENLKMRDFPTLAHVIQFVYDHRPDLASDLHDIKADLAAKNDATPGGVPASPVVTAQGSMDAANAVPRRVPIPRLRPSLDLCKSTGVSLGKGSRVVVMPDNGGAAKALAGMLKKAGVEALVIEGAPDAKTFEKTIAGWKDAGLIQGVYWLPALDADKALTDMSSDEWREALRMRAKLLFAAMRALYDQIGQPGTFLVSATRLGGQHGYDTEGASNPLGGAVTGLTKAMKREKSDLTVKAVDFESDSKADEIAGLLLAETLCDPGAVEIGYKKGGRWTVGFEEQPIITPDSVKVDKDSVFVVTGAAGSIVSAITADIAASAGGGTFYLLDLAPEPDAANPDIARLNTDPEGLKRDIFERLKQKGARVTPVIVDKEIAALERADAALTAIQSIRGAGGTAHYHSLNLLDNKAVAGVMKTVAERHGRVDALIHAAGLEISRIVPDKKPSEFDLVFDVKSDGWFNLLSGLGKTPIGAAVVFSSVAGRFGNAGQTDYSAANDLLCKCVSNFRSSRPETRGIAIDWTAWSGIGMAARGSIPAIMKQAGIDMLAPEAGIPITRRELLAGTNSELVIGGKLGIMVKDFDAEGGLSVDTIKTEGVMTGKVTKLGLYDGLTVETELDPVKQPFLYDHQIDGVPVLPGVMGIEAMAETARLLFPDLHVAAIEDVNFLAPFKFYKNQPRVVTVQAVYSADGDDIVADCRLTGSRKLHGQDEAETTTHFTGRVRLTAKAPKTGKGSAPVTDAKKKVAASNIYKVYFHGPAYQVIDSAWRSGKQIVARFAEKLPPNHEPEYLPLLTTPRLTELCFQASSLVGLAEHSRLGLPGGLREMKILAQPKGVIFAVVGVGADGAADSHDISIVDAKGKVYMTISGYRTTELPATVSEELAAPMKKAFK